MFENLNKKQKIIFIIIIFFMVSIIVYYIYSSINNFESESSMQNDTSAFSTSEDVKNEISEDSEKDEILIHISGSVKNEKVISLPEGSRIQDAINAAGGLTDEADLTNINLAYILEDGEKIYIPKKGEQTDENVDNSNSSLSKNSNNSKQIKVNINKASQEELEKISGIGPSTALKIINYRKENGKFTSKEDIKNVPGIGDIKYENIKDYIYVK